MQRITREQARKYAFDWRDEPLLRVKPGETFEIETYDASTGYFRTPEDLAIPAKRPGFDRVPVLANPIGGPVWVDGAKVADLRPGSCTSLLLPPGDHVVMAGTAAPTDIFGLSKLDLGVSVNPGDRVIATYVIDSSGALGSGMSMAATRAKAYRFTARPATGSDVCRTSNEAPVAPLSSEAPAKE